MSFTPISRSFNSYTFNGAKTFDGSWTFGSNSLGPEEPMP